jgi:murein DD-endopeptidase MepM/ murein hydrolase activator NlpD
MPKTLYRYNEETCQYERVKVKTFDVVFYLSGLLVTSIIILAGILVSHDYLIDSEKEIALRSENRALKKNQVVLASQLFDIENTLATLDEEDKELHQKFFTTPLEEVVPRTSTLNKKALFLGGAPSFRDAAKKVNSLTQELLNKSLKSNHAIARQSLFEKLLSKNTSTLPSISPVWPINSEHIVSGFGMRVNPFHKGMYEHFGLDFSLPRGTMVHATADGVVTESKRNTVQAGYGNYVEVTHAEGYVTRYAHLEELMVKVGQRITKGFVIGTSGNSGGSVAPHLHYEISLSGSPVNPVQYIIEGVSSSDHEGIVAKANKKNQSLD